jgi:putative oxidoreductase
MCLSRIKERLAPLKSASERFLLPLVLLAMRLKVGSIFLVSGWLKFGYVRNGQLDTLYFLFEDYKVPFLPTHVAAWMGMSGELGFGALLTLGLFGRLGALGLIFMSAVIYHTDGNQQAVYWALICAAVAAYGPGTWSLDSLIWRNKTKGVPA